MERLEHTAAESAEMEVDEEYASGDHGDRNGLASAESRLVNGEGWRLGKIIGERYILERRLGSGAMGEVFLGRDRLLKKHVAIKVLRSDLARSRGTVRRFLREVALAQSVTHPNVVRIYDTGECDGLPYFTMEVLHGQRLDELIDPDDHDARTARLTIREIREISWEILRAMQAAHEVGVIHRDLKPSNVLLTHRGAIVMDFGVAGIEAVPELPSGSSSSSFAEFKSLVRTEAGTIFGSPAYMAPELWESAPATVQSDLYAFGVMLYQMLTGKLPFDAPTPTAFLEKLRNESPTPVRVLRRDTPWNLALLVRRCMAADPDDRPPNAEGAGNLISPLRGRRRRASAIVFGMAATVATGAFLLRSTPTWHAYGLPDAVAEADLSAAVRSFDVGDHATAVRQLERIHARVPRSAAVTFWRATVHDDMGDEPGRTRACQPLEWEGSDNWRELAAAACGPTYTLAPQISGTLSNTPRAFGPEFLPLAVVHSLVPRLEATRGADHPVIEEASRIKDRLEAGPTGDPLWALPVRWRMATIDLALATGDMLQAQQRMADAVEHYQYAPAVLAKAAWLEIITGHADDARALADRLRARNPEPAVRLLLDQGRLDEAWTEIETRADSPYRTALLTTWCGYAYRFELPKVPERCAGIPPGLVRVLWSGSSASAEDRAAMTWIERTMLQRQRETDLGQCESLSALPAIVAHVAPPFELYLAQLEMTAAICSADESKSDLKQAQQLAQALNTVAPQDPWGLLVQAQVDDARGAPALARAKRLAVAERWERADPRLPLVIRLRRHLGLARGPDLEPTPGTDKEPVVVDTTSPKSR